ncbi:MAG: CHASE2 domain-containing protein [Cyanobacteria bacterium P01_A01_bin.105]
MSWRSRKTLWLHCMRLLPGLLVSVAVATLGQLGVWVPLENLTATALIRLRGSQPWDNRLVVVGIDDATLRDLEQFPISRDYYTELVDTLTEANAAVMAFDLLLAEPSLADADLAEAMAFHSGVVLAMAWGNDGQPIFPSQALADSAIVVGHIQQSIGADGVARQMNVELGGVPALSVATLQAYSLVEDVVAFPNQMQLQLNWPSDHTDVAYVSLLEVLNGQVDPALFERKIVMVGVTATGFDQVRTPFNPSEPAAGVYVHVAAVHNLLQRSWLRTLPNRWVTLGLLVLGPLTSWVLRPRVFRTQLGLWLMASGGWMVLCLLALYSNVALPAVSPLLVLGVTQGAIAFTDRLRTNALLQARSEFLSTMSHEIRTPLNAIVGVSEMLEETQLTAKQREFTETIHNSSQALMALINDVLDFSKIEAGKLVLEQHPVNLRTCVEQSLDIIAPRAIDKHLELVYAIDPTTPPVIVSDPVRLRQILLNLLGNAVKFTEVGEVTLHVRPIPIEQAEPTETNRGLSAISRLHGRPTYDCALLFSVRDTGIGIPADRMHKLFKPFSQVSSSTTRKYGGTGLGLAISKRLAETFSGRLWVESEVGKGSVFSFTVQTVTEKLPAQKQLPKGLTQWANQRCLIIDSNLTRRTSLEWQLGALALRTTSVASVAEALVLFQQGQHFALVMLDANVTKVDNISAMEALRSSAGAPTLPIVLIATLSENPGQTWHKDTIILWKPIKQAALYRVLIRIQAEVNPQLMANSRLEEPTNGAAVVPPNPLRILIAEDNPVNQRVAQRLLELLGYGSDVVGSGEAVIEALQHRVYDVVLMDMRMPGMDGVEATRRVRKLGRQIAQPWIVAMTANAVAEDRQRCLTAGMNDYLSKPIRRETLSQALRKVNADADG